MKDPGYIHPQDANGHVLVTFFSQVPQGRLRHLLMCQSGPDPVDCAIVTEGEKQNRNEIDPYTVFWKDEAVK